ncbi:MAG: hypothetical protein R3D26_09485 [Cyanobacteriota/Melainabacteria group bacterium]
MNGGINRNGLSGTQKFFAAHPKVKTATIGSGVGTAAGALTGLISGKGVMRGAAIGAGTGASASLVGSSEIMRKHPILRDTTVGTISGAGLALSGTRRGKVKNMGRGAGVGPPWAWLSVFCAPVSTELSRGIPGRSIQNKTCLIHPAYYIARINLLTFFVAKSIRQGNR